MTQSNAKGNFQKNFLRKKKKKEEEERRRKQELEFAEDFQRINNLHINM